MNETSAFRISQGLDVLAPKSGPAFPIPCDEWDFLKNKLRQVSTPPWIYQTAGSVLAGAGVSTCVTLLTRILPSPPQSQARIIASAVVVVSVICSVLCFFFADQQRKLRSVYVSEVIKQMELIEHRYERAEGPVGGAGLQAVVRIRSARYGAKDMYLDVTSVLAQRVDQSGLQIAVGNYLVPTDPCPGIAKELVVEYEHRGQVHAKTVAENGTLSIP